MKVKIVDFIKHHLRCYRDYCDEYTTEWKFDFILSEPCVFDVYGSKNTIDRIIMLGDDYEDVIAFANDKNEFSGIKVPKRFLLLMYARLRKEEKSGKLKGYYFSEEFGEMLSEMRKKKE